MFNDWRAKYFTIYMDIIVNYPAESEQKTFVHKPTQSILNLIISQKN